MLEARGVSKRYGGVQALAGADLVVRAGTVHALLGENGAGKSTLVKIIAGAVPADTGTLLLDGREVAFANIADAARSGVAVVSQELNLFPDLDVLANLFPAREPRHGWRTSPVISRREMAEAARPILAELGLDVRLRQKLGELTLAQRQLVEIAKALVTNPSVLILDEPTSALDAASTSTLMRSVRVLRDRKVAVVFVSHILEEVMAVSDEVTVLRDGKVVMAARPRSELTVPTIVAAMLGEHDTSRRSVARRAAPALDVTDAEGGGLRFEDVSTQSGLADVTFMCARGEVVGLAGLAGSGHVTVLELATGQLRPDKGRVLLPNGRPVPRGVRRAIAAGIAIVTGDRRRYGLMLDKPIWENIGQVRAIAQARDGMILRKSVLRERARVRAAALRVATPSVNARAGSLSGGNQQKVLFAKWLEASPSVMVLDDPTRGVDVGAKAEMHALFRAAADGNAVVLLSSTDLEEMCNVCDRVVVCFRGRICAILEGEQCTVHHLLESMNTGAVPQAVGA
jgi:ABC-type sugar transport system ATPase subunit